MKGTAATPTNHPFPPGTRVRHGAQIWACLSAEGTAEVIRAEGPDHRGDYEYLVRTGQDFSRPTGPDNPETRETWWASYRTLPAGRSAA
jgi:hypothetical protein